MKNYYPSSWSQQAREMANRQFKKWYYYNLFPEKAYTILREDADGNLYEVNVKDLRFYYDVFSRSYKDIKITKRASKRFGRLVRKYQKKGFSR